MKKVFKKEIPVFFFGLVVFGILAVICNYDGELIEQNTTLYAFSYKYGFIARGLLGTLWQWLDAHTPLILMSYHSIYQFSQLSLGVYVFILLLFYLVCLRTCPAKEQRMMQYLIVFLSVFAFPMFASKYNFGRVDIYLVMITLLCCILLVRDMWEWMIVPLCVLAMLLHPGFVFMNVNIILVLLLYKALGSDGGKRKKYIAIFAVTFVAVSALFLYFEFFAVFQGQNAAEEVIGAAKALSADGNSFSQSLIDHEVRKRDVFADEWWMHVINYYETPFFLLFFSPYIMIFFLFFKELFGAVRGDRTRKQQYALVLLGGVTVLPEIILKVDYGRYAFALIFYYVTIVICLVAMGEQEFSNHVRAMMAKVKNRIPAAEVLVAYPLIFMPFYDVHICLGIQRLVEYLAGW